jgi:hypothetical protein
MNMPHLIRSGQHGGANIKARKDEVQEHSGKAVPCRSYLPPENLQKSDNSVANPTSCGVNMCAKQVSHLQSGPLNIKHLTASKENSHATPHDRSYH